MSIKNRIEDANILLKLDRKEGALISALIAVSGTSRKRYPQKKINNPGEAFKKFMSDELPKLEAPGWSENSTIEIELKKNKYKLRDILWKYVRNALEHEATLPDFVSFSNEKGLNITILDNKEITFTNDLILYLIKIVVEAPENNDLFNNK